MQQPFDDLLADYIAASRRGETDTVARLQLALQDRCGEAVRFLANSAELDVQASRHAEAATKWAAVSVLRPNHLGYVRQELNALIMQGDLDLALRRLQSVGYFNGGFDHFYWSMGRLLEAGQTEAASEALCQARSEKLYSESDIAIVEAAILLAMGLDLAADEQINQATKEAGPNTHHALRLQARLLLKRGQYDSAAEVTHVAALAVGNLGDLTNSTSLREVFLRYESALKGVALFAERWPHLGSATEPLAKRLASMRENAENAVIQHGPLRPFNPTLVLQRLRGGQSASEILWARLALLAIADSGELPMEQATDFLGPLPAWEDPYVSRFLVLAFLNTAPGNASLQRRDIRSIALDPQQLEGLVSKLLGLSAQDMDGDALVYALHVLRQVMLAPARVAARLAEPAIHLKRLVSTALPHTSVEFRVFARAHIAALDLDLDIPDPSKLPLETRRVIHQGAIFGRSPWRSSRPCKAVNARKPAASFVVALSGQMRGFARAWPSTVESLIRPLNAPVVISLWDTSQNAMGRHAHRLERALPADLMEKIPPLERFTDIFQQRFPRSAEMIFGKIAVNPSEIEQQVQQDTIREYFIETEAEATYDRFLIANPQLHTHRILKMFAKFCRVDQIVTDMECQRGEAFTHVCWIRPDARLTRFSRAELNRLADDFEHGWGHDVRPTTIGDYFMLLPRNAFAVLAKVFPAAVYSNDPKFFGWLPLQWNHLSREKTVWNLHGPETIAAALFSCGIMMRNMISPKIELLGYMPPPDELRRVFLEEYGSRPHRATT